ncbi:MAG: hypothetical protein L0Z70_14100 [Chloroflexi bacterium]|nr:hypothetical protein [Chloroflexota bacterium]
MNQDFGAPINPQGEPKKKNTTTIIIVVVLLLLCCCLLVFGGMAYYLWTYGDQIFGLSLQEVNLLL